MRSYTLLVPSETITDSRRKVYIPVFRPKRHKNPTRWGGNFAYICHFQRIAGINATNFKKREFIFKLMTFLLPFFREVNNVCYDYCESSDHELLELRKEERPITGCRVQSTTSTTMLEYLNAKQKQRNDSQNNFNF